MENLLIGLIVGAAVVFIWRSKCCQKSTGGCGCSKSGCHSKETKTEESK